MHIINQQKMNFVAKRKAVPEVIKLFLSTLVGYKIVKQNYLVFCSFFVVSPPSTPMPLKNRSVTNILEVNYSVHGHVSRNQGRSGIDGS